jgi:nitroreductase
MDTMEAIRTRRSIRKFTDRPVERELVMELIEAAMYAPSAGNEQPWQFLVINDRALLDEVPHINPNAAMAREASVAILVCGDLTLEKFQGFWVQDCSAAAQNLLLAAHAKGLGAVWTGIYPMEDRVEKMRNLLGLPGHITPLALIPLGYPNKEATAESRFKKDRIRFNKWE